MLFSVGSISDNDFRRRKRNTVQLKLTESIEHIEMLQLFLREAIGQSVKLQNSGDIIFFQFLLFLALQSIR